MNNLNYSSILQLNKVLEKEVAKLSTYKIAVLSNIITSQLNEVLECSIRSENINAKVTSGDYDNLIQDSLKYADSDLVIIFFESANLIDGLQYKANILDEKKLTEIISKTKSEIDFLFDNLKNTSLVIFNKFSSLIFNHNYIKTNNFDTICYELNNYLEKKKKSNVILLDTDKILAKISIEKSVDFRFYYSSKALYTVDFYKEYSKFILPVIRSINGRAKKALIFDCDNTLWKGIIGEDGLDNIEMSAKTKAGIVFEEVQHLAVALARKGVLIGICSKNNPEDTEIVFNNYPDMYLRDEHISIKKINWQDKVSNLKGIAKELNIGLDSMVFIDDNDFELGLVNDRLPEVKTLKVPTKLYEYPQIFRENISCFYTISQTKEDLKRSEMYKQQIQREDERKSFNNIEDYLASLDIRVIVHSNPTKIISRIGQLTQKTNQFNLTTKRYTEAEIEHFIQSKEYITFAIEVQDKYGDSGITGVSILKIDRVNKIADIDTLLMSCRIIGRNIELIFFDFIIETLKKEKIELLTSKYIKTAKNMQVFDFYEKVGLAIVKNSEDEKHYALKLDNYDLKKINYIKITYGTEN